MISIKRNILTIKQNTSEAGRAKGLSAPRYIVDKFPSFKDFNIHLSQI
jgi:hypothetical protein